MTDAENNALRFLAYHGGSVLVTQVPEKTERGAFGESVPGLPVYKKLARQDLVLITEEEINEDGFTYTPMIELTDTGKLAAKL